MTAQELAAAVGMAPELATAWVPPIYAVCQKYDLSTPQRVAMFLAQVGQESEGLTKLEEDLDYSAEALERAWPLHFTPALAQAYAHRPELIANRAYASRFGNGSEASGDGWRFRGRGPIQITFRANYAACSSALGVDVLSSPELLLEPEMGALSAGWFWGSRGLNALADEGDVAAVTRRINGGANGLEQRTARYARALGVLTPTQGVPG